MSDNGTNFRATGPFIESWTPEEHEKYHKYTMEEKMVWRHIPNKQSGPRCEDFRTLVVEAEAVVNSRPITYLTEEDCVLRPIDFLMPNSKTLMKRG
ncbi:unnamed protein product, partial [Mesorhabditis belari]|uniref:Integrase catalytic domain-containing protein n=1 Tax=Mesorhabditis belari TaxID=2138241 RepID=A0AAF3EXF2_9BILA